MAGTLPTSSSEPKASGEWRRSLSDLPTPIPLSSLGNHPGPNVFFFPRLGGAAREAEMRCCGAKAHTVLRDGKMGTQTP